MMSSMPRGDSVAHAPPGPVETIRLEAQTRLRELEPMLEEAARLRGVLAALDGPAPEAPADGVSTPNEAARTGPDRRRTAPSGANKRRILEAIAAHPGITPREIAALTGIDRPVVASTVNRLKRRGEVRPQSAPGRRGGVALP